MGLKGKFITGKQAEHLGGVLTGLVAALDARGYDWTKTHCQDLKIAYGAVGHPCPFAFTDVKPGETPANKLPPPSLGKRIKSVFAPGS
ncbi:MAG: hypothetical protein V4607_02135 [Pseudomonadota bacterium]